MKTSMGIIGAGNMGEAFIGAVIGAKLFAPSDLWISDINGERLRLLEAAYGVRTTQDNAALFAACDIVILAVKPQQMNNILLEIAPQSDFDPAGSKLVISIAAGIRIDKLEAILYAALPPEKKALLPVIRVMPNTPALVLKGVSGMSANRYASEAHIQTAQRILCAMGMVVMFDEPALDAVTALSGSGPAYVFFLAESMIKAGIAMGLSHRESRDLTLGTLKGSIALMEERNESPEDLRHKVTSPGGTTEAAFKVLGTHHVQETLVEAIKTAAERSRELSR